MSSCMRQLVNRILKKSASGVLGSSKSSSYPRGYASGFESPAALLDGLFEHPAGSASYCPRRAGHRSSAAPKRVFRGLLATIVCGTDELIINRAQNPIRRAPELDAPLLFR